MTTRLLKLSFLTFLITYVLLFVFNAINSYKNEQKSVHQAYLDTLKIKENFDYLKQSYIMETTYISLYSFMQGKSIEEVKEILSLKKYDLKDFGIKFKTDCDYQFVFYGEEKIICNLNGNLKFSGDLIFKKLSSNDWVCEYTGNQDKTPLFCQQNKK